MANDLSCSSAVKSVVLLDHSFAEQKAAIAREQQLRQAADARADAAAQDLADARAHKSAAQADEAQLRRRVTPYYAETNALRVQVEQLAKRRRSEARELELDLAAADARAARTEAALGGDAEARAREAEARALAAEAHARAAECAAARETLALAQVEREPRQLVLLPAILEAMRLVASQPTL
jgi:hypothetical protein